MPLVFILVLAAGCGSGAPLRSSPPSLLEIRDSGTRSLLGGRIEISPGTITNDGGKVSWSCGVKNPGGRVVTAILHVRFFDESFQTEYGKFPVVRTVRLGPGQAVSLRGRVDFSRLPEGKRVGRLGLSASLRKNAR